MLTINDKSQPRDYRHGSALLFYYCRDKAREELKKAIPHLQNVIQNSCHIGKDHKKKVSVQL